MTSNPIRIGIIGMGGYAGTHHQAVLRLEDAGQARLVCTCDPRAATFGGERLAWRLDARGVQVFDDYRGMLAACRDQLDLVVVPTPIPLHAEMHAAAVAAGVPVYLEKPPTLNHLELETMIERDRSARRATLVGFNFIIERARRDLKARLLAGEFGRLREIRLVGRWPRPTAYFERNGWAGRLLAGDGRIILDSCLGNAMAHFVHNLLHWAGLSGPSAWAGLKRVRAELYRVHRIQGADTFFVAAETEDDVLLRIALSHACADSQAPVESLRCDLATLHYAVGQGIEIAWGDGRTERQALGPFDALRENHLEYYRYLRGESLRPATTLADCRAIVALNDLAHVSSGCIHALAPERFDRKRNEQEQREYLCIHDLASAQSIFLHEGVWPGSRGWGHPTGPAPVGPADLARFDAIVRRMAAEAPVSA